MKINKGISLIVLVITIIVIIILAGAVILSLSNNNPISSATEATFKSNIDAYNSELTMSISKKYVDYPTLNTSSLNATIWDGSAITSGTVKEYISSISAADGLKYIIDEGKLVYMGNNVTEMNWLSNSKIIPVLYKYNYTGAVQTFTAPVAGTYTLEVWGASGGGISNQSVGSHKGLGGYSKGNIALTLGQVIYIYAGGQGIYAPLNVINGGWNGGGNAYSTGFGGGGGTDIRTVNGLWNDATSLASRIIVAGGGGGADNSTIESLGAIDDGSGGAGGGASGENARNFGSFAAGTGGTQSLGTLGIGQNYIGLADEGAGGGGYHGGFTANSGNGGGGGGSGFIGTLTNAITQIGNTDGNGYVKISY